MALPNRSEYVTLCQRAAELVVQHGGVRAASRVLDIDHAYFYRLLVDEKSNPSKEILKRMGLKNEVLYKRIRRK